MGKGSKGGYYSSGGGGGDCDISACLGNPWKTFCFLCTVGWCIYAGLVVSEFVGQRQSEDPILHSGEMRPFELKDGNDYLSPTTEFTDDVGVITLYRLSQKEPPVLTPSRAAVLNISQTNVIPTIRDIYSFPQQYDWWYQNCWLTPGSTITLSATCGSTQSAYVAIVIGDQLFNRWSNAANGESGTTTDYESHQRSTVSGFASLTYTHTGSAATVYFVVVKSSTTVGSTISCAMSLNMTLIPYDLTDSSVAQSSRLLPQRGGSRTLDVRDGRYVLMVAATPVP